MSTIKTISTNGKKKISTLQKEFNAKFPFIRISIFSIESKSMVAAGETIRPINGDLTLSEVRTRTGLGEISIVGNKLVGTLESEFEEKFGLFVQVCYTNKEGKRFYTTGSSDKMTLSQLNKKLESEDCLKDVWC